MKIIYFVPESTTKAPPDPFLGFLKQNQDDLIVMSGGLSDTQIVNQMRTIFLSLSRNERIVVILTAFINPSQEGITDDKWRPLNAMVPFYLPVPCPGHVTDQSKALRSLRFFWLLWNRYGRQIVFLISLDRIQIKPFARTCLSAAFSENRLCEMYQWDWEDQFLQNLAQTIRNRVEV